MAKTIQVERFGEEPKRIQVGDNMTIRDAFSLAGIPMTDREQITTLQDASDREADELTEDGQSYVLVGNHVSGM